MKNLEILDVKTGKAVREEARTIEGAFKELVTSKGKGNVKDFIICFIDEDGNGGSVVSGSIDDQITMLEAITSCVENTANAAMPNTCDCHDCTAKRKEMH